MNPRKSPSEFFETRKKRNSKPKPSLGKKYQFVRSCWKPCTQSPKAVIPPSVSHGKFHDWNFYIQLTWKTRVEMDKITSTDPLVFLQNSSPPALAFSINTERDRFELSLRVILAIIISFDTYNNAIRFYFERGKNVIRFIDEQNIFLSIGDESFLSIFPRGRINPRR